MPNINTNGDPIESANGLKFFCMGADGGVGWFSPDALEDHFSERMFVDFKLLGGSPSLEEFFSLRPFLPLFRTRTGIWYDPQDLTTLYQDAAGTLPVYGPGTGLVDPPVGLMLDKSQRLELGPELAVDTTPEFRVYRTSTEVVSYTIGTMPDVSAGAAYLVSYRITENVTPEGGSALAGFKHGTTDTDFVANLTVGRETDVLLTGILIFKNSSLYDTLSVRPNSDGVDFVLSEISAREIKGYHAYQPDTMSRPTLSGRYNLLTATETLSTQSVTTVATNYTLKFEGAGTVTLSDTATGTYSAGTHTITCTAGTLTCTVAGSVTRADLRVKRDGSSLPAYQRVDNADTYDTAGFPLFLKRDKVDDDLIVQAPAITGAWAHGTIDGPMFGTVAIPAGEYHPFGTKLDVGLPDCTQWIAIDGALSASEQAVFERYVYSKARQLIDVKQFGHVRNLSGWLMERADITSIDLTRADFSNVYAMTDFLSYSENITEIDLSRTNLPFAPAYSFRSNSKLETVNITGLTFIRGQMTQSFVFCSNLTTIKLDPSIPNPSTDWQNTFWGTKLNQASIDAILVTINIAGTSNGRFNQSGGSAPSATGQAAITAMRSRGWTVTVTGGF